MGAPASSDRVPPSGRPARDGWSGAGAGRAPALRSASPPDVRTTARRAAYAVAALPALLVLGALGYVAVEGWSFGDGLYMTAMTITTVGYREVHPLSSAGRWLTGVVLFAGVSWLAVWFATVTSFFIEIDVFHLFRDRRMEREIAGLRDHTIVCGAGRTGTQVVAELMRSGAPYVVLDVDEERAASLRREAPHLRLMLGDTTRDDVLVRAGIQRARGLVAALSDDTDNLFVTITARALNPGLRIVARANDDDNVAKMTRAGADHVVSPQRIGGARMASLLLRPQVMSLLDVMTRGGGVTLGIEEVQVEPGSPLADRTLAELEIPTRTGALVAAIRRGDPREGRGFLFNPNSATRLGAGDTLIAMGESGQIDALREMAAASRRGGA